MVFFETLCVGLLLRVRAVEDRKASCHPPNVGSCISKPQVAPSWPLLSLFVFCLSGAGNSVLEVVTTIRLLPPGFSATVGHGQGIWRKVAQGGQGETAWAWGRAEVTPEESNLPPAPPRPEGKRVRQDLALKEQELLKERTGQGGHRGCYPQGEGAGPGGTAGPAAASGPLSVPGAQTLGRGSLEHGLDPPTRLHTLPSDPGPCPSRPPGSKVRVNSVPSPPGSAGPPRGRAAPRPGCPRPPRQVTGRGRPPPCLAGLRPAGWAGRLRAVGARFRLPIFSEDEGPPTRPQPATPVRPPQCIPGVCPTGSMCPSRSGTWAPTRARIFFPSLISPPSRGQMGLAPFSLAGPVRTKRLCGEGCASAFILAAPGELLSTQQALGNGISDSKRAPCFYCTNAFSFYSLPPPPPSSSVKWCTLPLRLKWWHATIGTPLPVGRGRDPSPLTPEVVCALKMATPYVTDETGGECGRRGAVSLRALGAGVRTWKRVCAPPIPGPLLCPALRTAFPIHSYGVPPAPPSGLEFRGLCFRSPKPWGPSIPAPTPGPSRALKVFSSS